MTEVSASDVVNVLRQHGVIQVRTGGFGLRGLAGTAADAPLKQATNTDSGNANAITATTAQAITGKELITLPIVADNTSTTVTVAFNGGSALTIKTASGESPGVGLLLDGMVLVGFVDGSNFKLLSEQASATVAAAVAAAEAAATAAEDAEDAAVAAAAEAQVHFGESEYDGLEIKDEDGNVVLRINSLSQLRFLAAIIGDYVTLEQGTHPFQVGHGGDLLAYLGDDGIFRATGFKAQSFTKDDLNQADHTIDYWFVEGWGDASQAAAVSWISDSADAKLVSLSLEGAGWPIEGKAVRSRGFPNVAGKYIHTAIFEGLQPGATYEMSSYGATLTDTFTLPPRAGVTVGMLSDYQNYNFGGGSILADFGSVMTARGVQFMLLNGDYVNDDGVFDTTNGTRWFDFLNGISNYYRNSAGALIPFIGTTGNHEGRNAADTSNATSGGTGTIGPIADILTWGYDPGQVARSRNSVGRLTIGAELMVLTLETDHTEPLPDQRQWLTAQLAAYTADYRHTAVIGHAPAFYGGDLYELDDVPTQARELRNFMWPIMQNHADKIRFYGCGHDHFLGITARLEMDYDEGLTDAENDVRWRTNSDGIRQFGCGPWGATRSPLNAADMAEVSSLDGSPKFIAAMGYDGSLQTHGTGLTNTNEEIWNVWVFEFNSVEFVATAYGRENQQFYTLTETL